MSKSKKANKGVRHAAAAAHLPMLVDTRLAKALSHVLRQHILLAAMQGPVSPNELSHMLREGLSQVSYHVKVLNEVEMIELVGTAPRRGAVEHYYSASAKTLLPAKAWLRLEKGLRAAVGSGLANDLFDDLTNAVQAGKLQGSHDFMTRTPLVLDAKGQSKVKAIAVRATKEVESEQLAAAERMATGNDDGIKGNGYTFALLAFEATWKPAERRAVAPAEKAAARSGSGKKRGRGTKRKARAMAE